MNNLLVTGGAGFIGANFVHYWRRQHPQDRIVVLDALTYAGDLRNLADIPATASYRFIQGNIIDGALVEAILQTEKINTIVHFAAESHVDRSIASPDIFLETNIMGTHQLLKSARKIWSAQTASLAQYRFHHVSTDEVYGSLTIDAPAFTEYNPYAPNSPYAASKAASDHLVRAYFHTYGLPVTISHCSNNFGPYQFPEKFIPLIITSALQGKKIPVYGDGKNIRDWLYVEEHCRGIEVILQKGMLGESYNIGTHNEQTNVQIVAQLTSIIDQLFSQNPDLVEYFPHCPAARRQSTQQLMQFVADRPGHDQRYAINADKIRHIGFEARNAFKEDLIRTVQWYCAAQINNKVVDIG